MAQENSGTPARRRGCDLPPGVREIKNKGGTTYQITVSRKEGDKRKRECETFFPPPGLTKWEVKRELEAHVLAFKRRVTGANYDNSMTLADLSEWYFQNIAPKRMRAGTLERHQRAINNYVLPRLGNKRLRDLKAAVFNTHLAKLLKSGGQNGKPLAASMVNYVRMIIGAIFAQAVKNEIVTDNPMRKVERFPEEDTKKTVAVLLPGQVAIFVKKVLDLKDIGIRGLLFTQLYTGARGGELRALLWSDVNLDNGVIDINKSADSRNRITPPKSRASNRLIKIPESLSRFLQQHKQDIEHHAAEMGSLWTENNLVFPNRRGGIIAMSAPANTVKSIIKGTDIPHDFHPHALRHHFASTMIKEGVDVKTIQETLGHAAASVTMEIYSHAFAEVKALAMKSVGDRIDSAAGGALQAFLPAPDGVEVQTAPEGREVSPGRVGRLRRGRWIRVRRR